MPASQFNNQDFRAYAQVLDARHKVPGRQRVTADILQLYQKGRFLVRQRILQALSTLNGTADIWTKPGMTSSFLGRLL